MSNPPDASSAPGPMEPPPAPGSPEEAPPPLEPPPPPPPRAEPSPPNLPPPPPPQAPGLAPQPAPVYSPDGRWMWNGSQWVPVPQPARSRHNRTTAGILAILLGDFGAHKFYLGNPGMGILYLIFCWTLIPGIAGVIEGIIYLTMSDEDFTLKYG